MGTAPAWGSLAGSSLACCIQRVSENRPADLLHHIRAGCILSLQDMAADLASAQSLTCISATRRTMCAPQCTQTLQILAICNMRFLVFRKCVVFRQLKHSQHVNAGPRLLVCRSCLQSPRPREYLGPGTALPAPLDASCEL